MIVLPTAERLAELAEPTWRDYSAVLPGVSLQLRPLTSLELGAARRRAKDAIRKMAGAAEDLESVLALYGLEGPDASGARFNPASVDQGVRIGMLIGSVEIAIEAVLDWKGVFLAADEPALVERRTLAVLLLHDAFERKLIEDVTQLSNRIFSEGKG